MPLPIKRTSGFSNHRRMTGFRLTESARDMLNYLKQVSGMHGDAIVERLITDEVARVQEQLRATAPQQPPTYTPPEMYANIPPYQSPPTPANGHRRSAQRKKR